MCMVIPYYTVCTNFELATLLHPHPDDSGKLEVYVANNDTPLSIDY